MDDQTFDVENSNVVTYLELCDIAVSLRGQITTAEASLLRDRAAALRVQLEELDNLVLCQTDRRIQQSTYQAMLSDFPEVDCLLDQETSCASRDGRSDGGLVSGNMALRTSGKDGFYDDHRVDPHGNTQLNEYVEKMIIDETQPARECYVCIENLPHSATMKVGNCPHVWCRQCLVRRFEMALKNEDHYPVRCCGELTSISVEEPQVAAVLGEKMKTDLAAKIVEYGSRDRTYCYVPTCSTFIDPSTIMGTEATCPSCQESTCTTCKAQNHGSTECTPSHDEAFDQWREESEAATCPACHRVIIISHGCNHMRCHCGTEFCYECNDPWKTCECEIWDERRLLARAAGIVEHEGRPADIEQVAEGVREERECRHDHWTRVDVRSEVLEENRRCGGCAWAAQIFLWRCDGCGVRLCSQCYNDSVGEED
ncbi:hypothetical protein A1O3_09189 [Capronia epimyces CBS 606.96]|uniref:RBR-type E3 ubiquitin transferase n=1 Tax=Capronia epimyces CBS 606.96 TaxID=1182542 RepID=W9Y6I3_9EURO|nr:uncharacterized protein A1O3_09189 [Capronia epimyces CBS 606.96]EXJ78029.1 hypothetical protein A1O3_09189 [Capronia epimyces CBS 606.96]